MTPHADKRHPPLPSPGDIVRLTRAASVQFTKPLLFRIIRVRDRTTHEGWVWLDGYELNAAGRAVERREVFVQISGLQSAAIAHRPRHGRMR
ncbi:hypothetical protein [Actinoplanes sp. NPDC051859]|uniref:hypothetical protein n=1 Tax=Actinoplanes sp. NPDC051859 TaxID=3363909 RepID=UPI0037AF9417